MIDLTRKERVLRQHSCLFPVSDNGGIKKKWEREKNLCNSLGSISRSSHDHWAEVQGEEELNGGKDEEAPRISIRLGIYLLYVTTHMVKGYNGHIYYKRDVTSNNAPEDMIRSSVPGSKSMILGKAK